MKNSGVTFHQGGGVLFSGPDAVNLVRAITLKVALRAYTRSKMLMTRGLTPTKMLQMATPYTGKAYKRGQQAQAAEDLQIWVDTMKAALPVTHV